jgi:hypothetical protein
MVLFKLEISLCHIPDMQRVLVCAIAIGFLVTTCEGDHKISVLSDLGKSKTVPVSGSNIGPCVSGMCPVEFTCVNNVCKGIFFSLVIILEVDRYVRNFVMCFAVTLPYSFNRAMIDISCLWHSFRLKIDSTSHKKLES